MHSNSYNKFCQGDNKYTNNAKYTTSELFERGVKYYNNLTKNMTLEEIIKLYERIKYTINMYEHNSEDIQYSTQEKKDFWYKAKEAKLGQIQKIFCQVIYEKLGMKFLDKKQYDTAILEISRKYLKENLKFSIYGYDKVSEEQNRKRYNTIYKEYIRYRAQLVIDKKKSHMSFQEFVEQRYGLKDVNVSDLVNLEQDINEEIKGMKK